MKDENKDDMPLVQWFPGHMAKARKLITDNLKLVDVVIELLDARIPYSSANPMLKDIIANKPRMVALNKADLADPEMTKRWVQVFEEKNVPVAVIDSMNGKGMKELVRIAEDLARAKTEKFMSKGATNARAARAMILGIPNVGKSSLINRLAGAVRTKTADKPGVTRAKQWIKVGKNMDLLDTPGILWPKFEDRTVGLKLAFTGAINDEVYDMENVVNVLLDTMRIEYPQRISGRYKLTGELPESAELLLEAIGRKRGCLVKGGCIDFDKARRIVLNEFRAGKMGLISLDRPNEGKI